MPHIKNVEKALSFSDSKNFDHLQLNRGVALFYLNRFDEALDAMRQIQNDNSLELTAEM